MHAQHCWLFALSNYHAPTAYGVLVNQTAIYLKHFLNLMEHVAHAWHTLVTPLHTFGKATACMKIRGHT